MLKVSIRMCKKLFSILRNFLFIESPFRVCHVHEIAKVWWSMVHYYYYNNVECLIFL